MGSIKLFIDAWCRTILLRRSIVLDFRRSNPDWQRGGFKLHFKRLNYQFWAYLPVRICFHERGLSPNEQIWKFNPKGAIFSNACWCDHRIRHCSRPLLHVLISIHRAQKSAVNDLLHFILHNIINIPRLCKGPFSCNAIREG